LPSKKATFGVQRFDLREAGHSRRRAMTRGDNTTWFSAIIKKTPRQAFSLSGSCRSQIYHDLKLNESTLCLGPGLKPRAGRARIFRRKTENSSHSGHRAGGYLWSLLLPRASLRRFFFPGPSYEFEMGELNCSRGSKAIAQNEDRPGPPSLPISGRWRVMP